MANITGLTIEDRIEIGTYYGSRVYTLYAFCTPAGAEQNVAVNVQNSNPGMFTLARTTAITVGDNFTISGHSGETCVIANLYFNSAVTGNSIISFTDSNAGLVAQKTIYNNPVNVSPNIYISPSSITLSAETFLDNGRTGGPYKLKLGDVISTGCVYNYPTPCNGYLNQKGPNDDSWEKGRPSVDVDGDEYYLYLINQNSGETRWYRHELFLQDTSGDVYINGFNNFVLYQEGSGSTSGDTSGSTSGDTSGSTSGDTSGSTSGDTSGSTSGDTSGSTSGDTSGSTSGDTSGYTPATGSCIEVTYDTSLYNGYTISSWPSGTKILGGSGAVQSDYSAMIYTGWIDHAELEDGTQITRTQYRTGFYDFGQEGIYTIRYYTNGRDVTYGIPLLPEYSFQDCGRVVSVKIIHSGDSTKDIQAIGGKAFAKTSLACITLPEGIRDIDTYAFSEVKTLSCITFPASLSNPVSQYAPSIAGWVLESATSLNKIFAKGMTAPPIGSNTFKAIPSGGTLYYPVGSDYSTWLDALPNWTWATYDPYAVDTCDCAHDGENVPIIESGTTNPPSGTPYISLSGYSNNYLAGTGSCVSLPIIATNCTYSSFTATIDYNPNLTAHSVASVTEENGSLKLCLTSNPLTGDVQVAIITVILYDTNGNSYLHYGNENPDPPIPSGQTINSGSTSHTITYSGCPLVFDHSASTGTWNTLPTVTTAGTTDNWSLTYDVPANDTDSARTITYYYLRYSGETCEDLVDTVSYTISQNAGSGSTPTPGTTPDPWSDTGDTAYTWYKDDSLLRVLPPSRVLSYDEETAYWPVTAHTFNNVGVRASGDVVFNYELIADGSAEYNSHSLYAHTQNNTGTTQQVSTIKLVAFSGSSAYSASTVLMKNPDSHGWITASPNPVNGASSQNSVNVYLTLTNCERNISKETTDNAVFDAATWVSVSRVNNTALTFNFQANNSNQARSTYYYAYGLDNSGNNVYCRIDITQAANSMGITITPDRTSLGKPAGSFTARVESTESGNFSFSAASWMVVRSYVPESQKAGTLYVDYYENTGKYTRVGDITVSQQISTAPYILTARTQISQTNTADTAYIRVTPSSISVDRTAGVVEAQVSYAGLATVPALVQNEGNMSIVSYNLDSGLITIAYGANDTSMDKHKNFTVTAMSSNGNVIEANFTITQGGTGLPVAPIWRDYVITVPTPGQGYINYNINYDGTVVYTGRAYGMGQDNIEIYYNHLCKPFLSNHIDFTEGYQSIRDWLGNFIITSPELGDITSVSFYEDYSYVNRDITNVMSLNNPIINEVVEGSYVPFSFFITGTSGNVSIMQNGQQITGLTVNDNEQHRYFVEAEKGKAYSSLGAVYKTIPVCSARYSLYYINSYGGVDVLPFKGKSFKKTDNITRLNYSRSFRNNTLEFENVNYMNEMKPAWELNTSYMVDSQSRKMHELVESTCVYLYDAEEQTYTPVVMTDKKLEYKTFYNQGRRFYTYTINVEESQSRERR